MKRMLIVGNEYTGIKSVTFGNVKSVNITDYQILLIDMTTYQKIEIDLLGYIRESIKALHDNKYPIICILPRDNYDDSNNVNPRISPFFVLQVVNKPGTTVNFADKDDLMNIYKKYVTKHEIVLGPACISQLKSNFSNLMWNNVKEYCSILFGKYFYLLHPPDRNVHKKAIASLVDYLSPDMEEEKEEKPAWVSQYELDGLGLQEIENKMNNIDNQIKELSIQKNNHLDKKETIAKWTDLITKQGKTLEIRLIEAFKLLEVETVEHEPNGSHGPDLVIQHKGKGFTIEVEGTNGPVRIDKARELMHWIADAPPDHKGILIGNPFREFNPEERPPKNKNLFVKEAEQLAQNRNFVLTTSYGIFKLVCKKIRGENVNINDVLSKLYASKGEVNLI